MDRKITEGFKCEFPCSTELNKIKWMIYVYDCPLFFCVHVEKLWIIFKINFLKQVTKTVFSFNYEGKFDYGIDIILFWYICFLNTKSVVSCQKRSPKLLMMAEAMSMIKLKPSFNESCFISGGVLLLLKPDVVLWSSSKCSGVGRVVLSESGYPPPSACISSDARSSKWTGVPHDDHLSCIKVSCLNYRRTSESGYPPPSACISLDACFRLPECMRASGLKTTQVFAYS